jgi:hypothetical protein
MPPSRHRRRCRANYPRAFGPLRDLWHAGPVSRSWRSRVLVSAFVLGCNAPPSSTYDNLPEIRRILADYELAVEPMEVSMGHLSYRPPDPACPQAYRLHASYAPSIKHEDDSTSHLVLGHDERHRRAPKGSRASVFEGQLVYSGVRAERRPIVRDWALSSSMAGPAAPTAACFPRTWDPVDDAFALGWPRLAGGPTAVGSHWAGLRVEGKCNRSACIDPHTGGGGPDNHHRTCVTDSWQETLEGVYEVDGQRLALVRRTWSDGHGEDGIHSEGLALLSIDHGRPVWAHVVINHVFPQLTADDQWAPIVRTWTLEAIDDCPGSLVTLGWQRPDEASEALSAMLEAFDRADELRSASKRTHDAAGQDMEQRDADAR